MYILQKILFVITLELGDDIGLAILKRVAAPLLSYVRVFLGFFRK